MTPMSRDPSMPNFNPTLAADLRTRLRQAVESYANRGRRFGGLDDDALRQRFVLAVKAWCTYQTHPDTGREVNDASAEYLLRRKAAPIDLVVDDVAIVFEGCGEGSGAARRYPQSLDDEPKVLIVVVLDFLPLPMLFAPFLGSLLSANHDRYGTRNRTAH
jgi:hypothetical protein